jgi:hypothetical protein
MGYWLLPSCLESLFRSFETTTALQVTHRSDHLRSRVHVARRFPVILVWFSPDASHGVSKERPSIGLGSRRPLLLRAPPACAFGLSASARPCQGTSPVPSPWFSTTLAVFSVESLAGFLHPAADHGVRRVGARLSRHRNVSPDSPFRDASPFEASPRLQLFHRVLLQVPWFS